jgi:BirA family transcriptional regulator, biotin operon repressor / biotin---[acetyl-CoA-carboxylase] ligase
LFFSLIGENRKGDTFGKKNFILNLPGKIIEIQKVDSTNSYAERILMKGNVPEGTIIIAKEQSEGKGQGKNKWLSEPGKNLTLSWILYPKFLPVEHQFMLNKSVSLGVFDFIRSLVPEGLTKIKWPNDIYFELSKLGGILINHTISGTNFDYSIIGIGINLNQMRFDQELPNPISVRRILSREIDIADALVMLIGKLENRYDQLKKSDNAMLSAEYKSNLLGLDDERNFMSGNDRFSGFIRDVDAYGRLIIETSGKERRTFAHGEVEMLL